MFSNICRACLSDLSDLSDAIPLFDVYHNVYYYRLCNELQLSIDENELPRNVCKSCAEEISKSYKFRMMYMESARKLNEMLNQTVDCKKDQNLLAIAEQPRNIIQTTLEIPEFKWKCDKCSAAFEARSMLRQHVKQLHCFNKVDGFDEMDKQNGNEAKRWKCIHCSANFRTRKLKYQHQNEHHQSIDPIRTSDVIGIHHELESGNQIIDVNSVNISKDEDSSYREAKFIQSCVKVELTTGSPCLVTDENHTELYSLNKSESDSDDFDMDMLEENHSKEEKSEVIYNRWKCKICLMCLRTRKLLNEHKQLHKLQQDENTKACVDEPQNNSEFRWKCKQCSDTFRTRNLLTMHRKIHPNKIQSSVPKEWQCTVCFATFPSHEACKIHHKVEHRDIRRKRGRQDKDVYGNDSIFTSFTCEICDKIFPSKVKIRRHIQKHKDKEEKKNLCTICGLIFASTNGLNRHIRIVHHRERNFHCTSCDNRFSSAYRLKMHMNRHEGIRPFACEVCGKSFYGRNALYTHRRSIHLSVNKFVCQICSKAFNRIDNLRSHLRKVHQYQQPNGGGSDSNL